MVSSIVLEEARRFCQTTSVRGVSRIINSKSTVHSIIWLLGVLTCSGFLIWQVVVVFLRYWSYPVNAVLSESPKWDNTTFPDITICNLCSLVYEDEMSISYSHYVQRIRSLYSRSQFLNIYPEGNSTLEEDYRFVLGFLTFPSGYFLNFHFDKNLTESVKDSPILDCSYFNWEYNTIRNYNCLGSIKAIYDPDNYKCYTLRLDDTLRKNTRGFSAVIYVKDVLDNIWINYRLDLKNSKAKGMKVLVHDPGTKPNMNVGIGIETGKSTTITLQQTKITRLPEPYSNCTSQLTLEPLSESPTYTEAFCKDVCIQEQFLESCGCIYNLYQFTDSQLRRANSSFCGDISFTNLNSSINWNGAKQILCAFNVSVDIGACNDKCPLPCQEFRNIPTIYANAWPHATSQLAFFLTYLNGSSQFGNNFKEYLVDYKYNFINQTAALSVLDKLDKEGLIQKNFLQLNIQFSNNVYQQEAEVAAFSQDAFGAQLGGVLSLWLGVTIMLIFEICEFIINLISAVWVAERNKPAIVLETVQSRL